MNIVITDYENNNTNFWNEIHTRAVRGDAIAKTLVDRDRFVISDLEEVCFREYVTAIDGWDDPKAAKFAPHPLLIEDISGDHLNVRNLEFSLNDHDDNGKVFIDSDTVSADMPPAETIERALNSATGREWKASCQWHPTGDSEQLYCSVEMKTFDF